MREDGASHQNEAREEVRRGVLELACFSLKANWCIFRKFASQLLSMPLLKVKLYKLTIKCTVLKVMRSTCLSGWCYVMCLRNAL